MPFCPRCGSEFVEGAKFCPRCGAPLGTDAPGVPADVIVVTTPTVPNYRVRSVLGIVTGLTARTRGIGGKFVAGIQSAIGGEVSAFTFEMDKARFEAIDRLKNSARQMGANAVIGVDFETSEVFEATVLISVAGTAVIVEPE